MNSLSKLALVLTFCTGMIACSGGKAVKGDYGVVPLPQEVTLTNGNPFVLSPSTKIFYPEGNDKMKKNAEFLASYIKEITGYELATATGQPGKGISLVIDQSIQNPEGYQLTVSDNGIRIAGSTDAGVFYGIQTLRKSIPATAQGMNVELPAATINDYPRFAYRGMMLDVSRHFFPVDSVKTYLDILALHNQNTFHWHLSDDQGWRIEIKKYPELTQIGSKRKETVIGHNSGTYDGKEYGGFYTQDQIRDVINYAAERHITIIPEIDMPGHQLAALATYPELGCTGGPYDVWGQWGVADDVICAGNEKSMQFLEDVLSEVIDLFPLEKVYSFEPTAGISPEDQKYVIGAQANLWTEYIPTFSQVEYMIMPRIDAVADIQWSDPSKKDYQTFLPRVARMTQLYDRLGYNYGKHIFDINASLTTNTENGTLDIALTKLGEGDIYYTVDGSDPTIASIKYEGPVQINQDCEFKAIVVRPNGTSRIFSEDIFFNKATMKPITLKEQPSKGYVFNGAQVLVDGLRGGSNYKTGHWLGFQGKDLDATIDLKEPTEIQKVSFNTNVVKGDWIMGASAVTVKVSDDGKNFKEVASKKIPELTQNDKDGLYPQEISFAPVKARYVEVIINSSKLPKWHGGAGSPAFLFVDEIEIL